MFPRLAVVALALLTFAAATPAPIDEGLQPIIAYKNNIGFVNPPTTNSNAASRHTMSGAGAVLINQDASAQDHRPQALQVRHLKAAQALKSPQDFESAVILFSLDPAVSQITHLCLVCAVPFLDHHLLLSVLRPLLFSSALELESPCSRAGLLLDTVASANSLGSRQHSSLVSPSSPSAVSFLWRRLAAASLWPSRHIKTSVGQCSRVETPEDPLATDSSVASRLLYRFPPLAPRPVPNSHPVQSLARAFIRRFTILCSAPSTRRSVPFNTLKIDAP
ncbi:hypothetical protein B0H14DRAFT_3734328 [Mycena olivaceomarginata]|nr:hypothetical protein B0H14DRAFT_3734328 [Mycena olivaceomarginata]